MDTFQEKTESLTEKASEIVDDVTDRGKQIATTIEQGVESLGNSVSQFGENTIESVRSNMSEFGNENAVSIYAPTMDFLESNSMVAKFAFLLLVVIGFLLLFYFGLQLISFFTRLAKMKIAIIPGQLNGNAGLVIPQNPALTGGIQLYRSNNQLQGAVFTYSLWLNVAPTEKQPTQSSYLHAFNVGNQPKQNVNQGVAQINNAPGVYLTINSQNQLVLHVVMDTDSPDVSSSSLKQTMDVPNIPIGTWVHVAVRLENNVVDTYVNGNLAKRMTLSYAPRLNYNDIWIGQNTGFPGMLGDLYYYARALSVVDIQGIVRYGPPTSVYVPVNVKTETNSIFSFLSFDSNQYLSNSWYAEINST